jgi:hypothetical protein
MGHRIGTTSEEVERELDLPHTSVSARRRELRQKGYTGYWYNSTAIPQRRKNRSGKTALVDIVLNKGLNAIAVEERIQYSGDPTLGRHGGNPASNDAFKSSDFSFQRMHILKHMAKFNP